MLYILFSIDSADLYLPVRHFLIYQVLKKARQLDALGSQQVTTERIIILPDTMTKLNPLLFASMGETGESRCQDLDIRIYKRKRGTKECIIRSDGIESK